MTSKMYAVFIIIALAIGFSAGYILQTMQINMLKSEISELTDKIHSVKNIPYEISMYATSPHVANGSDYSQVIIYVRNIFGELLSGVNVTLSAHMGFDTKYSYPVYDAGNGTYYAYVNSTIAGDMELFASTNTGLFARTSVKFIPGPIDTVEILDYRHPRETTNGNCTRIYAAAFDAYGNIVPPPRAEITILSDLGEISSTKVDDFGIFYADVNFTEFGVYNITAIETTTELMDNISIEFNPVYLHAPRKGTVNDTVNISISVYIPYDNAPLAFYNFTIIYNETILQPEYIIDGYLYDNLPQPDVVWLNKSAISISQHALMCALGKPAIGNVKIANITFRVLNVGASDIILTLANNSIYNLLDENEMPILNESFKEEKTVITTNKTLTLKLKIWIVENQANKARVLNDIKNLKRIFKQLKTICGTEVRIEYKINKISKNDWVNKIDKDKDGLLDEYVKFDNPTDEEKALLENFFKRGYLNVYYIKEFDWKNSGGSSTTGEYVKKNATHRGVIIDSDNAIINTLAHEIGHYFGLKHVNDPNNLMYPYAVPTATKITKDQCKKLIEGIQKEFEDCKIDFQQYHESAFIRVHSEIPCSFMIVKMCTDDKILQMIF